MPSEKNTTRVSFHLNAEHVAAAIKDSAPAWLEDFRARGIDYPRDGKDFRLLLQEWVANNGRPGREPRSGWDTVEQREWYLRQVRQVWGWDEEIEK